MPAIPGYRLMIDGSEGVVCRTGDRLPALSPPAGGLRWLHRLSLTQHGIDLARTLAKAGQPLASLDVIYSPYCDALLAAEGVPQVITCHDLTPLHCPNSRKAAWRYRFWTPRHLNRADRVIAISRFVADQLLASGVPAQKIRVVENGVESSGCSRSAPLGQDVLMLARHDANKNVAVGIRGFALFLAAHPEWEGNLTIVGRPGRMTSSLRAEVLERNLTGRIRFLSAVGDDELAMMLTSSFALLSCSLMEGFDYPVLEAMAQGIPTLISDIPVHRELYADASFLWPLDDQGAGLARAFKQLHCQASLWRELSTAGLERAELYSLERQRASVLNVLEELR